MTLTEEKTMMMEIKAMQKMKGAVAHLESKVKAAKANEGAGDELKALCNAKNDEVMVESKKIGVIKSELDKLDVVRDSKRGKVQPLRDELTKIKAVIDEKYTVLKASRAKWKKDNDIGMVVNHE